MTTTQQFLLLNCLYLAAVVVIAYATRARRQRIVGAFAGGVAIGLIVPSLTALAEKSGWWSIPAIRMPYGPLLIFAGLVLSGAGVALTGWRVSRRFGWRGQATLLAGAALLGALRDYAAADHYPEWIVFGPGVIPVLVNATAYIGFVALPQAVMRLIAGPARGDQLARPRSSGV